MRDEEFCDSVSVREETIRIPMLIRYPQMFRAGSKPDGFFLSIDIQQLCMRQVFPPVREDFLIEYFSDAVFPRIRNMGYQAVRTRRWKYIHYVDLSGADELYDLQNVRVAVGISVARYPPHRSPRAALPHGALILDEWRQSELGDKDVGRAALGSIGPPVDAFAPNSGNPSDCDGSEPAATAELPDSGIRGGYRCCPVPRDS